MIYTDQRSYPDRMARPCVRCEAQPGEHCLQPNGAVASFAHSSRYDPHANRNLGSVRRMTSAEQSNLPPLPSADLRALDILADIHSTQLYILEAVNKLVDRPGPAARTGPPVTTRTIRASAALWHDAEQEATAQGTTLDVELLAVVERFAGQRRSR